MHDPFVARTPGSGGESSALGSAKRSRTMSSLSSYAHDQHPGQSRHEEARLQPSVLSAQPPRASRSRLQSMTGPSGSRAGRAPPPTASYSASDQAPRARKISSTTPHLDRYLPNPSDLSTRHRSTSPTKVSRPGAAVQSTPRSRHLSAAALPLPRPRTIEAQSPRKQPTLLDPADQSTLFPESPAIKRNRHLLSSTHNLADFRLTQSILGNNTTAGSAGDRSVFPIAPHVIGPDSPDRSTLLPESPAIKRAQQLLLQSTTNNKQLLLADLTLEELKAMSRPETAMSLYTDASFLFPSGISVAGGDGGGRAPRSAEKEMENASSGSHPHPPVRSSNPLQAFMIGNETLRIGSSGFFARPSDDQSDFDLLRDEMSFMKDVGETSVFL